MNDQATRQDSKAKLASISKPPVEHPDAVNADLEYALDHAPELNETLESLAFDWLVEAPKHTEPTR